MAHELDDGEVPPEFKRFKVPRPRKTRLRTEDLITPEEFQRMLAHCRTPQERAIIAILYEAGPRAEELLCFNLRHVEKDQHGFILRMPDVDGLKTGARPLRIIRAAPYLQEWLNVHAAKRGLDGQAMKMVYGWSDESDMPATYVHLSRTDADSRLLASYGIEMDRGTDGDGLKPLSCPRCSRKHEAHIQFCASPTCNAPLTPQAERTAAQQRDMELRETLSRLLATANREDLAALLRQASVSNALK